jgi:hypothetical protein
MILAAAAALLATSGVALAETVTYKGTGTYSVVRVLMPLSNGGAVLHLAHDTIATVEPSKSGFMSGDCAGLGYISPEGEVSIDSICNLSLNSKDGLVIRNESGIEGAKVEVIGGSGKFEGATGSGKMTRKWVEGNQGSYDYELKVSTP